MILLLDGNEISYKIGFGSQHSYFNYEGHVFNSKTELKKYDPYAVNYEEVTTTLTNKVIVRNIKRYIDNALRNTGATDYLICFNHENNFRNELATILPYKGNRDGRKKPIKLQFIIEYLKQKFYWEEYQEYEADDLLACYYNEFDPNKEGRALIHTQDKDLLQVSGYHWNLGTEKHLTYGKINTRFFIDEIEGNRNFFKQLLHGDPVDNIPGLFQITGKKCKKTYTDLIDKLYDSDTMCNTVQDIYAEHLNAKDQEDLNCILWEIANLIYMRRTKKDNGWNQPFNENKLKETKGKTTTELDSNGDYRII